MAVSLSLSAQVAAGLRGRQAFAGHWRARADKVIQVRHLPNWRSADGGSGLAPAVRWPRFELLQVSNVSVGRPGASDIRVTRQRRCRFGRNRERLAGKLAYSRIVGNLVITR